MKIDEQGIELENISDVLNSEETNLQSVYGADFYIKPEGVIDNIFTSAAFQELDLQEQIAFLCKQFDPETAEGIWQDALYERIGVYRLSPEPTTFTLDVIGTVGYEGTAGDCTIQSTFTKENFINTNSYTLGENGKATLTFACVVPAETIVQENETFNIVTAPSAITNIDNTTLDNIDIGRNRETDDEFRVRFRNSKAANAKASQNANISNLEKYVDDLSFLSILDKKIDNTIPVGTVEIIAKPNTTDDIFATAIFNTIAAGIDTTGNTTVTVFDIDNQPVNISFYKADEIDIDITATIKIKAGYFQNNVFNDVKNAIIDYVTNTKIYGLKSSIYATELIVPALSVSGVEAVTAIQIKRSTDVSYTDELTMTKYEVPEFSAERITLNAAP